MPNPCFISFRHYGDSRSDAFVEQFAECLNSYLTPICGDAFIDYNRMRPGYNLPAAISEALCQSACMIIIWAPKYFDKEHLWCTKEYQTMIAFEEERLAALPQNQRSQKLIIPVIFSGKRFYPANLAPGTLYLDFSKFGLFERKMKLNRRYAPQIQELAEYIAARLIVLQQANGGNWFNCNAVQLPTDEEALNFIQNFNNNGANDNPFPFREN